MEYREKYCRHCCRLTVHSRINEESGSKRSAVVQILAGLASIWCLWPFMVLLFILAMPFLMLVSLVSVAPLFRCTECGRRNWRPGGRALRHDRDRRDGTEYHYDEIRLVRQAPVAREEDLIAPITRIVRTLAREGDPFHLWAYSPAFYLYPIRTGWWGHNVWRFVTTSEIQWHNGRDRVDPTHQVVFFNWTSSVVLKIQFVVVGTDATCPGLVATLNMRTDVHAPGDRTARLDRLFSRLIEIVQPDYGCVLLPGHPETSGPPNAPAAGWLTYLARAESAGPLSVPLPSVAAPFAAGVKVLAVPLPAPDDYAGAADAIKVLQEVIRGAG